MNNKIATVKDWIEALNKLPQDATLGVAVYTPDGLFEYEMVDINKDIKSVKEWEGKDCYFNIDIEDKEIINDYYIDL